MRGHEEPSQQEGARRGPRLWLVRHGQTTWNLVGLVQGQVNLPQLTADGVRQVRRCADLLTDEPVGAIYSSDLRRAVQTARPIGDRLHLEVVRDSRLRERSFGTLEGLPRTCLGPERSGIRGGRVEDADVAPEGGETIRQLYRRAADFLSDVLAAAPAGDVALITHGGVVRVLLAWLDGIAPDEMAWDDVDNGFVASRPARAPEPVG